MVAQPLQPGMDFTELPFDAALPATTREFPRVVDASGDAPADENSEYASRVRGMISDAREFNAEVLMPIRVRGIKLYLGIEPSLDEAVGSSTIVKTEVKDTILSMLPSLMRIFTGQDGVTNFIPNSEQGAPQAEQATDYIRYVFFQDNPGYMLLQDVLKDSMIKAMGVARWWTDQNTQVVEESYERMSLEQRQFLISQPGAEVVRMDPVPAPQPDGTIGLSFNMVVRYTKRAPMHRCAAVPPDEFRINRLATCVKDAALCGQERFATKTELLDLGVPPELITDNQDFSGGDMRFGEERMLRNMGSDSPFGRDSMEPVVRYGDYYIRVDKDGDGRAELRHITTIGDNDQIVIDEPATRAKYAICCVDPEPHSIVGHGVAELCADLQVIGTNMLRGALDSLASTIYPRLVGVDTLVDWDDVLNTAIGAPIRVKDIGALTQLQYDFKGAEVFGMMDRLDAIRIQRTGITEQSKGLDPKALQSTTLKGVDMLITGAQERIELVARTAASTFMVDLMSGLLQETVDNPVPERVVQLRGKYVPVNPSQFDATMACVPNPAMGRGSDMDRWMMLQWIGQQQKEIMMSSPINPLCGPMEVRNTYEDTLALAGMRNSTRYFKAVDEAAVEKFMQGIAAKENPEMVYAKAEADKVRASIIKILTDSRVKVEDLSMGDDRERDKTEGDQMLKAAEIDARYGAAVDTAAIRSLWAAPRVPPAGIDAGGASAPGGGAPIDGAGGMPPTMAPPPVPDEKPELPTRTALGAGPPKLAQGGMPAGLLSGSPFGG